MRKVSTVEKTPYLLPDVVTKVVSAPTDGWDAISPLAAMDPKRAAILDNWVPRPGWVELRGGWTPFAQIGSSAVESLMVYRTPTGETLFAASGSNISNVSSGGLGTTVVTSLNSARWQYVNYTPLGGSPVIQCVNGADSMRQWNGSSWTTPTIMSADNSTPISTSSFININTQKRRIWYVVKNSTLVYFMPTDAIQGPVAGSLDLGALWTKGGYLVTMSSWTVDGGSGPQDYALFISSRGQVTIYSGLDPTNTNAWSLVGVFDIAPPIGYRCTLRVGSDVGIITQQGVIPISQALPFDPSADRSVAITARIQNAMAQAAMTSKQFFGWQIIGYPSQQLAILNVPLTENQQQVQYVMNVLTGAWCRFTGWNSNCFEIFNDNLYFGGNSGQVALAYSGSADFLTPIAADMQCAFNWFDEPGRVKRMTMIQPLLNVGGTVSPSLSVDTDFGTSNSTPLSTTITGQALWDVAVWDIDVWPALSTQYIQFLSVSAIGHAMAVRLKANINPYPSTPAVGVFDYGQFDSATFDSGPNTVLPVLQVNAFNSVLEMGAAI